MLREERERRASEQVGGEKVMMSRDRTWRAEGKARGGTIENKRKSGVNMFAGAFGLHLGNKQ